jgi:hypothetical protein
MLRFVIEILARLSMAYINLVNKGSQGCTQPDKSNTNHEASVSSLYHDVTSHACPREVARTVRNGTPNGPFAQSGHKPSRTYEKSCRDSLTYVPAGLHIYIFYRGRALV